MTNMREAYKKYDTKDQSQSQGAKWQSRTSVYENIEEENFPPL